MQDSAGNEARRPLDGVRVLDFTRVLAGPYCTALLADLGAEVIKVEPPDGDDYRHVAPFLADRSSAMFASVNRGKKGLCLDLKLDEHRAIARELASRSDVVIENFRPGVASRLGIGWSDLSALNPTLVYTSISGFGQDGPNAGRPAYDIILQGLTGLMEITGDPAGEPMPVGEPIADILTGVFAAWAVTTALFDRERTGRGRYIDVSMFDCMVAVQPTAVARYLATGEVPRRVGSRHPLSAPFGAFKARDGQAIIAVLNKRLFDKLANCIGDPGLATDPRFATDWDRLQNEALLRARIEEWLGNHTVDEAVALLIDAGVPAGPVGTIGSALNSDQTRHRPVLQSVRDELRSTIQVPEQPVRFAGMARGATGRAPELGEHTEEILKRG